MKKLLFSLALLALPLAFSYGQVSVSGLAGKDGYTVLRAQADLTLLPGLSIVPEYAMYERDNYSTMSQYGLGARARIPFIDIVEVGATGTYIPKANAYSNYAYDLYASVNIENLLFRLIPTDELKIGAGYKGIFHSFYEPDSDVEESDIYFFISEKTGGLDMGATFVKAVNYNGDKSTAPQWLDVPYFTAVYGGFLDYSVGAYMGYTYKIVRPYVAYNYLKTEEYPSADDLRLGLMLNIGIININGAVEWLNFSQNTEDRQTLYSLSAGVSLF
ncbi:MAG: hypothetical protein LBM71_02455 [Elusimicrobiota bacterium]|jgi:hypothetical protein|nr:hypothetical protein [Elusimicrobiota bacterium]